MAFFPELYLDAARCLDFTYEQATGQVTITKCIGVNRVIWTREMRNTLLKDIVEVIDASSDMQNRFETGCYCVTVALSPGRGNEGDNLAANLCHSVSASPL